MLIRHLGRHFRCGSAYGSYDTLDVYMLLLRIKRKDNSLANLNNLFNHFDTKLNKYKHEN